MEVVTLIRNIEGLMPSQVLCLHNYSLTGRLVFALRWMLHITFQHTDRQYLDEVSGKQAIKTLS